MTTDETTKDLDTIEVCKISDIGLGLVGPDAPPLIDSVNEYLKVFAKPVVEGPRNILLGNIKCLQCGLPLNGACGTFTWGIGHGEGHCSKCGWPCRAYHRPRDSDGEEIFDRAIEFVLQYHPAHVA